MAGNDVITQEGRSWYLLSSRPREEERACSNLMEQGYHVYLPMVLREHRNRRRRKICSEALFPRYLFILLSRGVDNWAPIRSTPGVSGLVGFGVRHQIYRPLPASVIDLLKQHEDRYGYHQLESAEWFSKGDHVRITSGPFSGIEGVFMMDDGLHRSMVLIEMLGKYQAITVESGQLDSV